MTMNARALFLRNTAEERIEVLSPLHRIVPESFLMRLAGKRGTPKRFRFLNAE